MKKIADTPAPPYYAVIFSALPSGKVDGEYDELSFQLRMKAKENPGFLGMELVNGGDMELTISYWATKEDILNWKQQAEHLIAQKKGKEKWYDAYKVRVCKVERDYAFEKQLSINWFK